MFANFPYALEMIFLYTAKKQKDIRYIFLSKVAQNVLSKCPQLAATQNGDARRILKCKNNRVLYVAFNPAGGCGSTEQAICITIGGDTVQSCMCHQSHAELDAPASDGHHR
jgi:hypothetical protein